jgi:anti-sigma factor RsiW
MTGANGPSPDDAELAAFLDGELPLLRRAAVQQWLDADAAVRDRMGLIARGDRRFREAFDLLLRQAPRGRLEAMLHALGGGAAPARRRLPAAAVLAGAGIALFAFGAAVGRFAPPCLAASPPAAHRAQAVPGGWRQAVAEYFSLDTADSLAAIPDDITARQRELEAAAAKLKLSLPASALTLPGLTLKRADVFVFRGMALAEILYLDPRHGPVALCIIANGRPDAGLQAEIREGLNIVFWQRRGLGFLIVGRTPPSELTEQAKSIAMRLQT